MRHITVLDCTLRDGGYCNHWNFGKENIGRIADGLVASHVDYIEFGFLSNRQKQDPDRTQYAHLDQIASIAPERKQDVRKLVMVNYGEYEIGEIPDRHRTCVDGIRVAFHKKDADEAIHFCLQVKKKGFLVFVQPMVTMHYTEAEFLHLIQKVNALHPYAFYVVDSFGAMTARDLSRYLDWMETHLGDGIAAGFHGHNNLQLAFSNAQYFVAYPSERPGIVDVSAYGMGRGAGNLNAELFLPYLRDRDGSQYAVKPILELIDEIIKPFYEEMPWGYSLPQYLSAVHMLHPNYATYLSARKFLSLSAMDEIFAQMHPQKRLEYDETYIEELYPSYLFAHGSGGVPVTGSNGT